VKKCKKRKNSKQGSIQTGLSGLQPRPFRMPAQLNQRTASIKLKTTLARDSKRYKKEEQQHQSKQDTTYLRHDTTNGVQQTQERF
jgi:hypothetical protein